MHSLDSLYPVVNTIISAVASQSISIAGGAAVEIAPVTQGVWAKFGDSTVAATAGTAAEIYCPPNTVRRFARAPHITHVAVIQAAATASGSVTVLG